MMPSIDIYNAPFFLWGLTFVISSDIRNRGWGACLVPWAGGPLDASFGFYLREAEDIIQRELLGADML